MPFIEISDYFRLDDFDAARQRLRDADAAMR